MWSPDFLAVVRSRRGRHCQSLLGCSPQRDAFEMISCVRRRCCHGNDV